MNSKALAKWFEKNQRILPWRSMPTPYRVWVSEIMLQQTQVATVVPYFDRFMERFPNVEKLAFAREQSVMKAWEGLGYYSRARNLHKAAKILKEGFPETRDGWLEIPGVGPYTAGAILSIAFDHPESILDGNVERVMARQFLLKEPPRRSKDQLWKWSSAELQKAHSLGIKPSVFNQALMELGAKICTYKNPKCKDCPVKRTCRARVDGEPEKYPLPNPKKSWIRIKESAVCLINRDNEILLAKSEGKWRSGLWDFPSAPPENVGELKVLGEVETRHIVTRHRIIRRTRVAQVGTPVRGKPKTGTPKTDTRRWAAAEPSLVAEYRWVSLDRLPPVGSAFRKTLKALQEQLSI